MPMARAALFSPVGRLLPLAAFLLPNAGGDITVGSCGVYSASWGHRDISTFYMALEYWRNGPPSLAGALVKPAQPEQFNISVVAIDSGCQEQVAFESSIRAFAEPAARPDVIAGCVCSGGSLSVGRFSTSFAVPMLVSASQSSRLSDKRDYPNLFRFCTTELSDADMHSGVIAFLGLKKVTVIYVDSDRGVNQKDRLLSLPAAQAVEAHIVRVADQDYGSQAGGFDKLKEAMLPALQGTSYVVVIYTASVWGSYNEWRTVVSAYDAGLLNNKSTLLLAETVANAIGLLPPEVRRAAAGSFAGRAKPVASHFAAFQAWAGSIDRAALERVGMPSNFVTTIDDTLADPERMIQPWLAFRFEVGFAILLAMQELRDENRPFTAANIEEKVLGNKMVGIMGTLGWDAKRDRTGLMYEVGQWQPVGDEIKSVIVGEVVLAPDENGLFPLRALENLVLPEMLEAPECPEGMDKPFPFAGVELCSPCVAGRVSSAETGGVCQPCSVGLFSDGPGQSRCRSCPPGTFSNASASTACTSCLPGTSQSEPGATVCETCQRGKAAPGSGAVICDWCGRGRFQPLSGQASCESCGDVLPGSNTTSRGNEKREDCVCSKGDFLFRQRRDDQPVCRACPDWFQCPGGNGEPLSAPGYYSSGDAEFLGASPQITVRCRDLTVCPGGLALGECPRHRKGLGCDVCELGFADSDGVCVACSADSDGTMLAAVVVVLGFMFVAGLVVYSLQKNNVARENFMIIMITGGLALSAMQTLSSFSRISVEWIEPTKSIIKGLRVLALDLSILQPGCIFTTNNAVTVYIASLLAYPVVALTLSLGFLLAYVLKSQVTRDRFLNAHGFLLMVSFLPLSLLSFLPWQCEDNPDGSTSVAQDRSVLCWSGPDHASMIASSVLGLLVYVLGFLAITVTATLLYPSFVVKPGGISFLRRFRFLFGRFEPVRYYYGLMFAVRSLLISVVPVLLVNVPHAQVMTMAIILAAGLSIESFLQPWRVRVCSYLSVGINYGLLMVLFAGATLVAFDTKGQALMQAVLMVNFTVLTFCGLCVMGAALWRIAMPKRRFGAFICHHKLGAGALARVFQMAYTMNSSEEIFIDSDHLNNLDLLFGVVATDVHNLVVVWTGEVLCRMWCAGEIATAVQYKVNIVPIACDDHREPDDDFIESLPRLWSVEEMRQLSLMGIEVKEIQDAYRTFRGLERFPLQRLIEPDGQMEALVKSMGRCPGLKVRSSHATHATVGKFSAETRSPSMLKLFTSRIGDVAIVGNHDDPEALSSCMLLQLLLQWAFRISTTILTEPKQEEVRKYSAVLAVLSRGVLGKPHFASFLTYCLDQDVTLVPVHVDPSFAFPGEEFWKRMSEGSVLSFDSPQLAGLTLEIVMDTYKCLFKEIAKSLTTHGSQSVLLAQAREIRERLLASAMMPPTRESSRVSLGRGTSPSKAPLSPQGSSTPGCVETVTDPEAYASKWSKGKEVVTLDTI